jgi:putative membrane protein
LIKLAITTHQAFYRKFKMNLAANMATSIVALLHIYFMVLEMFLWTAPIGRKAFGLSAEKAEATKVMAANQGLYNGFLAAGLVWGIVLGASGAQIKVFFLTCVIIAGIYGAATASRKILLIQGVPAIMALALVLGAPVGTI